MTVQAATAKRRDVFVWAICNWLINHVASKQYRAFLTVILGFGKETLDLELKYTTDSTNTH